MARRYNNDYSRFEELSDDESGDAQGGHGGGEIVVEQWQSADRVPAFQQNRACALLCQLIEGRGALNPDIVSAFNGTRSLLSNIGVLQLPQRRTLQLYQPSPLPTWCAALESLHQPAAVATEAARWLVAGLGSGATLLKAVSITKRVTFVGIDTMQPSLARVLRDTMRLNAVTIATGDSVQTSPASSATAQPKLPGLAMLRKQTMPAGKASASQQTNKTVVLLHGCLESASCNVQDSEADAFSLFDTLVLDPELFDDGLIGRRLLPSVRNAHKNLLGSGAQVLPQSAKLCGAVVELQIVPDPAATFGVDLAAHGDRCGWAAAHESLFLAAQASTAGLLAEQGRGGIPWKLLSEPFDVWKFQLDDPTSMLGLPDHDENDISTRLNAKGKRA